MAIQTQGSAECEEVLFHQQSEYQDVKIVNLPSLGNTLLLDELQTISENDLTVYTHSIMQKGKINYFNKRILILGGGDGALLYELLKENPKYVTVVEIDQVVIEACREHMRPFGQSLCSLIGSNYRVYVDDCMDIMRGYRAESRTFDYIFNDLTDIPVAGDPAAPPDDIEQEDLWSEIEDLFRLALGCLERDGRYMTHATGSGNAHALELYENFLKRTPVKFDKCEIYVPSFKQTWMFYTIRKDFSRFSRPSQYAVALRDSRHQTNRYQLNYDTAFHESRRQQQQRSATNGSVLDRMN